MFTKGFGIELVGGKNMIRKVGSKYVVLAKNGRKMGTYETKKEAEKRLRQIEFFKHLKTGLMLRAGSQMLKKLNQ